MTGLAGTLVAAVLAGMTDGAVEKEGARSPSWIASMGGWLELDFLPWVLVQAGCSSCADRGGVRARGGVEDDMIIADGGADIPLYEWAEPLSFTRGES